MFHSALEFDLELDSFSILMLVWILILIWILIFRFGFWSSEFDFGRRSAFSAAIPDTILIAAVAAEVT